MAEILFFFLLFLFVFIFSKVVRVMGGSTTPPASRATFSFSSPTLLLAVVFKFAVQT